MGSRKRSQRQGSFTGTKESYRNSTYTDSLISLLDIFNEVTDFINLSSSAWNNSKRSRKK